MAPRVGRRRKRRRKLVNLHRASPRAIATRLRPRFLLPFEPRVPLHDQDHAHSESMVESRTPPKTTAALSLSLKKAAARGRSPGPASDSHLSPHGRSAETTTKSGVGLIHKRGFAQSERDGTFMMLDLESENQNVTKKEKGVLKTLNRNLPD